MSFYVWVWMFDLCACVHSCIHLEVHTHTHTHIYIYYDSYSDICVDYAEPTGGEDAEMEDCKSFFGFSVHATIMISLHVYVRMYVCMYVSMCVQRCWKTLYTEIICTSDVCICLSMSVCLSVSPRLCRGWWCGMLRASPACNLISCTQAVLVFICLYGTYTTPTYIQTHAPQCVTPCTACPHQQQSVSGEEARRRSVHDRSQQLSKMSK